MKLFAGRSPAVVTRIMPAPAPSCPSVLVLPMPVGAPAGLDRAPWRGYLVRAFVLAGGKPRREETTLAALVRLIARAAEPAGDADRAILTALVVTWRRLRRDENLPALTALDQLRAFLAPDEEARALPCRAPDGAKPPAHEAGVPKWRLGTVERAEPNPRWDVGSPARPPLGRQPGLAGQSY
jgi:hypothetical protein